MPLSAVLFDLDGTLVDSERDNVESVVLAMHRFGHVLNDDDRFFIVGHSWNEIHQRMVVNHGLQVSRDLIIAAAVEEKQEIQRLKGVTALPGAVQIVNRLGARVPLCVVSGSSHGEVEEAVDGLNLRAAFQFLMGAEDYERGKPDPQPYAMAMKRLGVNPNGCLVLEDASPGIQSGLAAGAQVVGVRAGNFSGYDLSRAHAVVQTLDDVDDSLIRRLFGG